MATLDTDQLRRARNESLFREVNERISELDEDGFAELAHDYSPLVGFVCECPHQDCAETIKVTRRQYEAVRTNPRRFLVLPGHEDLDLAGVVERHSEFYVVEKLDEAAEIAVEQDPRS
jgi:hypothetical protein